MTDSPDFSKLLPNELKPGEVKDLGPANFFRISSKPDLSQDKINEMRLYISASLKSPFACQKGFTSKSFKNTGSLKSQAYIFYLQSNTDYVLFKLRYAENLE